MLETDDNVNDGAPAADESAAEPAAESPARDARDDAAAEAPDQVAEEVVAPEEPADEPTAEKVAEEPAAEEAPAESDGVWREPDPDQAAPAPAAEEPQEQLPAKEARKRARSLHSGDARPQRSPEERAEERAERRRTKARQRRAYRQKQRERRGSEPRGEASIAPVEHLTSQGTLKVRQGVVVSDKADKTITVRIDTARQHRMYKKIVRTSSTLHAHDERNEAHVGDTVRLIESRPLSRTKRWRLVEVLERAR